MGFNEFRKKQMTGLIGMNLEKKQMTGLIGMASGMSYDCMG